MHRWTRRIPVLVGALWVTLSSSALALSGVPATPAQITFRTLDNGVRVIVKENHGVNLVAVQVWVRVGSRYETRANNGVSHLLEHLVFRSGGHGSPPDLKREVEAVGGYVNAETTRDSTHFEILAATEFYPPLLEALAQALSHPKITPADVDAERKIVEAELASRLADPTHVCGELLMAAAFRQHPYGLSPGGNVTSLGNLTAATVRDFHSQFYVGPNMSVIVVGDVKAAEAVAQVRAAFATMPDRKPPPVNPPMEPALEAPRQVEKVAPLKQVVMSIGFHAPGIQTPDEVRATDVLLTALGEGPSSILHDRLQGQRPLVTAFQVDFLTQKDPGLFSVTCVLPRAAMNAAQRTILSTITDIREHSLTDKQLALAKNVLEGMYTYQNETNAGQASSMGFYEAIDTYKFALSYIDEFRRVTRGQVQAVARKYFDPQAYVLAVVEPPPAGGNLEAGVPAHWRGGRAGGAAPYPVLPWSPCQALPFIPWTPSEKPLGPRPGCGDDRLQVAARTSGRGCSSFVAILTPGKQRRPNPA